MSGPKDDPAPFPDADRDRVRAPRFAGTFYPDDPQRCAELAGMYVKPRNASGLDTSGQRLIGGIVPHAGWVCSGEIAGQTIGSIASSRIIGKVLPEPDVVIVLGAVHTPLPCDRAILDAYERWAQPGLENQVFEALREKLQRESEPDLFAADNRFHEQDHAIEVELPLIAATWPRSAILPLEVPAIESASRIGEAIAELVVKMKLDAVILASSDLTHYGPAYRLTCGGDGIAGLRWAKDNDKRLLDRIERFEVERIVGETRENFNACGGGAIAAMLAACRAMGAAHAKTLRHASSFETLTAAGLRQRPDNAVGYAAVVVG